MDGDINRYAIRFKSGNFYAHSEGIKVFESYNEVMEFFKQEKIEEYFELINEKEIVCQISEKKHKNSLCLIWSKTNETIWEKQ